MRWFLTLVVLLAACANGKHPEEACGNCALATTQPPPDYVVAQAIGVGKAQAALTCNVTTSEVPNVNWRICDFIVPNGISSPGGGSSRVCASGATYRSSGIWISLAEQDRVIPLVTWEARNWYWIKSGCGNQAY
jgi:hypothetical protein